MKRLGISVLVCLVASVIAAEDIVCPEGKWMTTLPHEDCHQFHLCIFGRAVEIKCPFGMYWDSNDGGCTRTEVESCVKVIVAEGRQDPPQPPVETTSWPPMPPLETTTPTTLPDTDETTVETDETTVGTDETPTENTDETPTDTDETPSNTDGPPSPPFSTTGGTPTPPFSTTGGDTPTPPISTTPADPTPPASTTTVDVTGSPPESTTGQGETTTGIQTGTPETVTTTTAPPTTTTTTTTTPAPTTPTVPPPPTCPNDDIFHYFPDPQACNRFFLCRNGQVTHMTCAPGQIFDQTYLRCRHDGVCAMFGWLEQH